MSDHTGDFDCCQVDDIPEYGLDAVAAYLDDQIEQIENVITALKTYHRAAHAHTKLNTLRLVRKEIEWISVQGYTPKGDDK